MRLRIWVSGGRAFLVGMTVIMVGSAAASAQVRRLGAYSPSAVTEALRHTDAEDPTRIFLLDENFKFSSAAANTAFGRDRVYVADGQVLLEFRSNSLVSGPIRTYNAGSVLLDVEVGRTDGQVVLLTRSALTVVDLNATPSPRVLSSLSVTNNQPVWGELIAKFGDTLYVADNSIRGFRVVDIHDPSAPAEVGRYTSKAKVIGKASSFTVTDLRRDGSTLSLVVGGDLELIRVDNLLSPSLFTSLGVARFPGITLGVLGGGYAFLIEGPTVHIVRATPGTAGFLGEALKFSTTVAITDLAVHRGRLYLLCGKQGYEVWDVSAYVPS